MSAGNALHAEVRTQVTVIRREGQATIYRLPTVRPEARPIRGQETGSPDECGRRGLRLVPVGNAPSVASRGRRIVLFAAMLLVYGVTYATAWLLVHGTA